MLLCFIPSSLCGAYISPDALAVRAAGNGELPIQFVVLTPLEREDFMIEMAERVFVDPVIEQMRKAGIYNGLDLSDIVTIQVKVAGDDEQEKVSSLPEVNTEEKSLTFYVSTARYSQYPQIEWELCQSILELWRETDAITPLELEWTHVDDNARELFEQVQERLEAVGSWRVNEWVEGIKPDRRSGGGSWLLELPHPVNKINGRGVYALKIKRAVAYGVLPPQDIVHMEAIRIDLDDEMRFVQPKGAHSPEGGISWLAACDEFREAQEWIEDSIPIESDLPVAVARYKNRTFEGKDIGFIVLAEFDPQDLRQEEVILQDINARYERGPTLDDAVEIAQKLIGAAKLLGNTIRTLHISKRYWELATLDNMTPEGGIRDRDNMKNISELPIERQIGYRLLDLLEAVRHFRALPLRLKNPALADVWMEPMSQAFLTAYFADELDGEKIKDAITQLDNLLREGQLAPAHELDNNIVRLMHRAIASDIEPVSKRNPERPTLVSDEAV